MSGTYKIGVKLIEDLRNISDIKRNSKVVVLLNRAEIELKEAEAYDNPGKYVDDLTETLK